MAKKSPITKLLTSVDQELINSRFLVKASVFDNGVHPKSYMLVIVDLLESGFTLKYFKREEDVSDLLKLLNAASK